MKTAFFGFVMFFLLSCHSPVITSSKPPQVVYNCSCIYMIEATETIIPGVGIGNRKRVGTAVSYKCDKLDENTYKVFFLTAYHIIEGVLPPSGNICINKHGRFESYLADEDLIKIPFQVESIKDTKDIAIVSVLSSTPAAVASLDFSATLPMKDIYILGLPLGLGLHYGEGTTTFSANGNRASSASVTFGNSGGGVFDKVTNKLIGIVIAVGADERAQMIVFHISYFVPLITIKDMLIK